MSEIKRSRLFKLKSMVSQPLAKALAIHIFLIVMMMITLKPHQSVEAIEVAINQPKTIQAKAISSADVQDMVEEKQRKENAAIRAEQEKQRRIQQERDRKRKAAEDKKRKEAAERKRKADAEKKRREDAERKKREEEEAERERQRAIERERIRKEQEAEEQRKRDEADRKRREAAAAAENARVLSERGKYVALIKSKISRNWIKPNINEQCVLEVRLATGGWITGVEKLSGSDEVCRTAMAAVYKSDPLPVSSDSAVFEKMRTLRLDLDPRDN